MSKRLKAPRYIALIAYLQGVMVDPKSTGERRMKAALRLDDLYARLDAEDAKVVAHRRKLELRALQVANPTLPLPASDPEVPVDEKVDKAFAFLKKGSKDAAVQSNA